MKKLYVSALFSCVAAAFDPSFETVTSGGSGGNDSRILANEPVALCDLDVPAIPRAFCNMVSLSLGGATYNRWVLLNKNIDHPEPYFNDITQTDIDNLIYHYHIGGTGSWRVPTEGQYYHLFQLGLIVPQANQKFWVFNKVNNTTQVYTYKPVSTTPPSTQVNSKIGRLVTDMFPEKPGNELIPLGQAYFVSAYEHGTFINLNFTVRYRDSAGILHTTQPKLSSNTVVHFDIPAATQHAIRGCIPKGGRCTSWVNMQMDPNFKGVCVKGGGDHVTPRILTVTPTNTVCSGPFPAPPAPPTPPPIP